MNIKAINVSKKYGAIQALDRVCLSLKPGKIVGVIGPNGCGKSTLIKIILGLVWPDSGALLVNEASVLGESDYRLKVGYLPQNPNFPDHLKIDELFSMLEEVRNEKSQRLQSLIADFALGPQLKKNFSMLSGGGKQKVAAVVALMFSPEVLILDEPTVGLDPLSVVTFKKLIREEKKRGTSILLVTHMMTEMEQMADEIVFLLDGRAVYSGEMADCLKLPDGSSVTLEEAVVHFLAQKKDVV